MIPLLIQNLRHVFRTRLIYFVVGMAVFVHWAGLGLFKHMQVKLPGQEGFGPLVDSSNILFSALFLQLFPGTFLAAVYGIWTVPYLHQGQRSLLTFTLPIPRWKFPVAYAVTMLGLLLVIHAAMFATFAWIFGTPALFNKALPWGVIATCLLTETIAFEVVMLGFSVSSLLLGQMATFLLGMVFIVLLQLSGLVFRLNVIGQETFSWYRWLYDHLPPLGELAFDLWDQLKTPGVEHMNLWLWLSWGVFFAALFAVKLRHPPKIRSAEG